MSNTVTRRMLDAYSQMAPPTLFLSGFFKSPPQNFHSSEEVEIDITRSGRDVSVALTDLSTGYRMNSTEIYTNKSFKPPIHKEAIALNSHDLIKRMEGENPFESPDFRANVILRAMEGMVKVDAKIRRSMEWQASQVLQTGAIALTDENAATNYALDFVAKATHLPDAAVTWSTSTSDKLNDLEGLADVINTDGLTEPTDAIFGATAWRYFRNDTIVKALLDNRRMELGGLAPEKRNGAKYMGWIELGSYKVNLWTYNGKYENPNTGTVTPFIGASKVIMLDAEARFDATFGAIPNIGRELGVSGSNLIPELPGRFSSTEGGMDLFTNVWLSADGEQLFGGVGARPLMIPTAIDRFGCLNTDP